MNTQQSKTLISRIKAMQNAPENTNHKWLFAWSTPIKQTRFSNIEALEEMNKAWRAFRANCKRNKIKFQGFCLTKSGRNHNYPVRVTALLIHKNNLETIATSLVSHLKNSKLQLISKQTESNDGVIEYIENIFSKSHPQIAMNIYDKYPEQRTTTKKAP